MLQFKKNFKQLMPIVGNAQFFLLNINVFDLQYPYIPRNMLKFSSLTANTTTENALVALIACK